MNIWLARDKCGLLCIYNEKPTRNEEIGIFEGQALIQPDRNMYATEVTWNNSPIKATVSIPK